MSQIWTHCCFSAKDKRCWWCDSWICCIRWIGDIKCSQALDNVTVKLLLQMCYTTGLKLVLVFLLSSYKAVLYETYNVKTERCSKAPLSQCHGLSEIPWTSLVRASKGSSVSVWDEPWQPAAGYSSFYSPALYYTSLLIPSTVHVSGGYTKIIALFSGTDHIIWTNKTVKVRSVHLCASGEAR